MSNRKKGDQPVEPKDEVREIPPVLDAPTAPDAPTASDAYIAKLLSGAPTPADGEPEERRADEWARLYGHVDIRPSRARPRIGLSEQRAFVFNTAMSHKHWGVMREGQFFLTNQTPITQDQYEDAVRGGFGVTQKG